jgi:ectoine hydroxylase-related dioxygenase (phytanoyl-CoA dioxygenase family)
MVPEFKDSDDHIAFYHEFGYAVIKGVFGPEDVQALGQAFDRVQAQALGHGSSYRHQNVFFRVVQDRALGRIVRYVQWPSYFDEVLARYRTDRRLLDIVAPILGTDLKQIINQMHWKPPGAEMVEFGYHQDIRFRRPRAAYRAPAQSYVQTAIAIDPHRRENGAMTFYPGSHKLGELAFPEGGRIMDKAKSDADLVALGLDPSKLVDLILEPGDVAFWNLHTIHGSGPNTSRMDRRVHLNGYVRADACERGEWAFRGGEPCALGDPVLVHYEDLHTRSYPHYVDDV